MEHIEKFKIELYKYSPYLYYLLNFIPLIEDDKIETACVTYPLQIRYNPNLLKLPLEEWGYIFIHELYHILFSHLSLVNSLNRNKWNVATDLFINNILDKQKLFKNESGLKPKQFPQIPMSVIEKSAIDIYPYIKNEDTKVNDCFILVPSDYNEEDIESIKQELEIYIGELPDSITKYFKIDHNSETNYKQVFTNLIGSSYKKYNIKRSFYKLNKFNSDLPTLKLKPVPIIGIIVDVSGSMGSLVGLIYNEILQILTNTNSDAIIAEVDTKIQRVYNFKSKKDLELKAESIKGFGGTCITTVVEHFNKQNIENVIYLTDGMLSYPSIEPKFNLVIGLIKSNKVYDPKFNKHKIIKINEVRGHKKTFTQHI